MGNHTATRARGRTPADPNVPITRTAGGVTVTYRNAQSLAGVRALFGRTLSPREMGQVVGVFRPEGAHITVRGRPADVSGQPFVMVDVVGHGVHTDGWMNRAPDGGVHVYNQIRTYDPAVVGEQARALALREQVRVAGRLGVTLISAKAYTNHDGTTPEYLLLPHMGYDEARARVEHENRPQWERRATGWPEQFASARTLSDLLAAPGGETWWAENGMNPDLGFNPAPGSRSMRTFASYLKENGLPGL